MALFFLCLFPEISANNWVFKRFSDYWLFHSIGIRQSIESDKLPIFYLSDILV